MRAFLVLVLLLAAGCLSSAPPSEPGDEATAGADVPDPLVRGARIFTQHEYEFGYLVGEDPTLSPYRYPIPIHGTLYLPDGSDAVPLVVLMHGRHGTCAVLGVEGIGTGACPNAMVVTPVTSYLGYGDLAENLASHGYAVASIDANTINDRDLVGDAGANARAQLILRTLDEFASVNATGASSPDVASLPTATPRTEVPQAQGRLDLARVGLMGHSRGGEGVARAVSLDAEAATGHGLDAVFALAPTDFARWPVAGVPFATLLPYCDGDVYNLQGASMYDDARRLSPAAPRHQVLAMGANHNWYNTVWTGDDWGTAGDWCGTEDQGSGRDTPEQQRAHGVGVMASFFRLYVGGETAFAPLWDGNAPWPDSMCPDWDGGCARRLFASHMPVRRLDLAPDGVPEQQDRLDAKTCQPAQCPSQPYYGAATQATWDCHGSGAATFAVPDGLEGWKALSLRVFNLQPGGNRITISVDGLPEVLPQLSTAPEAGQMAFPPRPGDPEAVPGAKTVLSEVRFPFPDGADLSGVASISLRCGGDGGIQVADVMLV